jgi:hypothetical protein
MILKLLPVEVDVEELKKPSSSIINPKVRRHYICILNIEAHNCSPRS